jgi:hypothetical protein
LAASIWIVLPFILLGALLYSSVGHGGATAYLAVLTLAGFVVNDLVTTVLVLNILAATIAFVSFHQAGHLRWRLLLPFLVTSVPAAYIGGTVPLSGRAQAIILGVALLVGAARFLFFPRPPNLGIPRSGAAFYVGAPLVGALLGLLAGATGIGGGIFLSPLLLILGWADIKEAASVASAFILLNSVAGLVAKLPTTPLDMALLAPMGVTVVLGAFAGAWVGARRLRNRPMQVLLGVVLLVAGARSLLG